MRFSGGSLVARLLSLNGTLEVTVDADSSTENESNIYASEEAFLAGHLKVELGNGFGNVVTGSTFRVLTSGRISGAFHSVALPAPTNGVVWELRETNNTIVLAAIPPPALLLTGTFGFENTTGLYHQTVTITNSLPVPIQGVRVFVPGLPTDVQLYNGISLGQNLPYLQHDSPIAPGQTVSVLLQYFVPDRRSITPPLPFATPGFATGSWVQAGTQPVIQRGFVRGDGTFVLEFSPVWGRLHTIQYGSTPGEWRNVAFPLMGAGSLVQWIDDGPPKTDLPPRQRAARYYRVIISP